MPEGPGRLSGHDHRTPFVLSTLPALAKALDTRLFDAANAERLSFIAFGRTDGLPKDYESNTSLTLPFYFQQKIC
jgi:hypothetical protein